MPSDHYSVLGVTPDADPDEIKRAYRRLARELHPDVNPDPACTERFKQVAGAYEVLRDPERRRRYDLGLDAASGGGGGFGAGFGGLGDFVEAFFGAAAAPRGPRPRRQRGSDALVGVTIELADALHGTHRQLTLDTAVVCDTCHGAGTAEGTEPETCGMCRGHGQVQAVQRSLLGQVVTSRACPQCRGFGTVIAHPCPECTGEGRVRTRTTLEVQVPAGVDTGTRIHLPGAGEVGFGGGPAGDLYVEIHVRPHPVFTRHGDDLLATLPLPVTTAALGASVPLETLEGVEQIDVAPGTQPGSRVLLRGRGMPRLRGAGRGDLAVTLDVVVPTGLDAEQRELLQRLAALRGEEAPELLTPVTAAPTLKDRLRHMFGTKAEQ